MAVLACRLFPRHFPRASGLVMISVSISTDDMDRALRFCNSYDRLPSLLDLHPLAIKSGIEAEWLALLGREWSVCDNISEHLFNLIEVLPVRGPVIPMMTETEVGTYQALPDIVTVYRGAGRINRMGASWSLDEQVARRFPTLNRYRQKTPMLYTARVPKERILAVKLDREEAEVITLAAVIIKSQRIGGGA